MKSCGDYIQKTFGYDCLVFELASVFVTIQNQNLFRSQSRGKFSFQQGFFLFGQGLGIFQIKNQNHFRGNFVHVLAAGSTAADGFVLQFRYDFFGFQNYNGWWAVFNKSLTVFTGLKVIKGTSTKTVIHFAIAPFHKPGNSYPFKGLPFLFFSTIKPLL